MPYYSRYRRRTGYTRYRRRYSGYRRRYYRRRSSASTVTSRSRCRVIVKTQKVVTLTIPANSRNSNTFSSSPYYDVPAADDVAGAAGAVGSPLYQAYANLYDSVKCDGVISRISVISPVGGAAGAVSTALTIVTAYDRMGTRREVESSDTVEEDERPTVAQLLSFSTVQTRTAINNSVAKTARSCWASDIQERTIFHDSYFRVASDDSYTYDADWYSIDDKCAYFAPTFWCGVQLAAATSTQPVTVNLLIEQVYYMTFRSPKYGVSQSSSATAAAARRAARADDALAAESLDDDPPQALVDMAVRAADATGSLVRTHGRSGLTPQAKKTRLLDEADRLDADARDRWARIEELDANLQSRYGRPTTATSYPQYERDRMEMMAKAASQRSATAASLREQAATLDEEDALSHTDTLPLDE